MPFQFQINTAAFSVGVVACLLAMSAQAAPNYRCTIEKRINASPELQAIQMAQEKAYIGKRFMVERKTGIITGALQNAFTSEPDIVDSGSDNSAYKVVSIIKADEAHIYGSNIYALTINEHASASQKPFAFLENAVVYMGQCEHV
tara:strand:- start:98 stop:532 length:435 start_codon:yes stop_codon:yes gene_type:complete